MSNKFALAGLLLALSTASWAQSSTTFSEVAELGAQLKKQEMLSRLAEAQAKAKTAGASSAPVALPPVPAAGSKAPAGPVAAPAPAVVDPTADLRVTALYGVGDNLFADVRYGGMATTVSVRGNARIGDWTLVQLTPYEMTLRQEKAAAKGKKRGAAATRVIAIPDLGNTGASSAAPGSMPDVPGLPPLPASRAKQQFATAMPALPIPMPLPLPAKE